MHRVLRAGGRALIQDMNRDTTGAEIDVGAEQMELSGLDAFMARQTLRMLRHRAYSRAQIERLAAESPFGSCSTVMQPLGMEVQLQKSQPAILS